MLYLSPKICHNKKRYINKQQRRLIHLKLHEISLTQNIRYYQ